MGTWTAFVFNAVIKDDSAASDWFLIELDSKLQQFRDRRSCYFPAVKHYAVFKQEHTEPYEVDNTVSICCSVKDYGNQIEAFLSWINPHLAEWQKPTQCLGYKQVMENDALPKFVFRRAYD